MMRVDGGLMRDARPSAISEYVTLCNERGEHTSLPACTHRLSLSTISLLRIILSRSRVMTINPVSPNQLTSQLTIVVDLYDV